MSFEEEHGFRGKKKTIKSKALSTSKKNKSIGNSFAERVDHYEKNVKPKYK